MTTLIGRGLAGRLLRGAGAFGGDSRGATAIEYAVIAGGIAVAIITTVYHVGENLVPLFDAANRGF